MGFIVDVIGGMGDAAARAGQLSFQERALRERDEANFIRERNLAKFQAGYRADESALEREFLAQQSKDEREFQREESKLDRGSRERMARANRAASGFKAPTVRTVAGENGEQTTVQWDAATGQWVPFSHQGASNISLENALWMAQSEYEGKASMFQSDQSQFGMTEAEWVHKRAMEIMGQGAAGNGGGAADPGKLSTAEFTAKLKQKYPGISQGEIDRFIKENADRLSDAPRPGNTPPKEAIELLLSNPNEEAKRQFDEVFGAGAAARVLGARGRASRPVYRDANATAGGRRADRTARRNAVEIARDEFENDVPHMGQEELRAWFRENAKYLSLFQQELVRRQLGTAGVGRNRSSR